jgi:hypothetical protein
VLANPVLCPGSKVRPRTVQNVRACTCDARGNRRCLEKVPRSGKKREKRKSGARQWRGYKGQGKALGCGGYSRALCPADKVQQPSWPERANSRAKIDRCAHRVCAAQDPGLLHPRTFTRPFEASALPLPCPGHSMPAHEDPLSGSAPRMPLNLSDRTPFVLGDWLSRPRIPALPGIAVSGVLGPCNFDCFSLARQVELRLFARRCG